MGIYIGHITIAGIVTFTAFFLGFTLIMGIIYAGVIAFSGGDFGTGFFKFMGILYAIVLVALIFGVVDLPCGLSILPALPNGWSRGCPMWSPTVPGL